MAPEILKAARASGLAAGKSSFEIGATASSGWGVRLLVAPGRAYQ